MLTENHMFILQKIFATPHSILQIINWGVMDGDRLIYTTNQGEQSRTISEIEDNTIKVVKLKDIAFKYSSDNWFKKERDYTNRDVVLDMSITTGEVYTQKFTYKFGNTNYYH